MAHQRNVQEPNWLLWARELQAISQIGLTYCKDPFDRHRYARLRELAASMMSEFSGETPHAIMDLFAQQTGYATPKVDVRAAVFRESKILLVRERSDGLWTVPGGWADVNTSPCESVVAEVKDEAGLEVIPVKLAAVYDRAKHPHTPPFPFHIYKMFFICEIIGGVAAPGLETDDVGFFDPDNLPPLSISRVLETQIKEMFEHARLKNLPTSFD